MAFCGWYRRRRVWLAAAVLIAAVATPSIPSAAAHLKTQTYWTFRYFTRADDSNAAARCATTRQGASDPVSVIVFQYGEHLRAFDHLRDETHFGPQRFGSRQVLCATNDGSAFFAWKQFDDQTGHGNLGTRAHFRLWPEPHAHLDVVSKFAPLTPHHEAFPTHHPDENWSKWQLHVLQEMSVHHNMYASAYYRWTPGLWRGFWHTGYTDRVGGLHDGGYP